MLSDKTGENSGLFSLFSGITPEEVIEKKENEG